MGERPGATGVRRAQRRGLPYGNTLGYCAELALDALPVGEHWIFLHAFDLARQEARVPTVVVIVP